MRLQLDEDSEVGVPLSPMIDCVFLLLIFFLVTTMMKRWERQIPLDLPEITSSLSVESKEEAVVIALSPQGQLFELAAHDALTGEMLYRPIGDLLVFLSALREARGNEIPLEIAAPSDVPVERVITAFDLCQLQGFARTRVRLGSMPLENPVSE